MRRNNPPGGLGDDLNEKAPCEKLVEILFCRYLLEALAAEGVQLFAPSSYQEYKQGYDARIVGSSGFRELYLQFKAPRLRRYRGLPHGLSMYATPHQHERLQLYPRCTAFYVTSAFYRVDEVMKAQRDAAGDPLQFLRHFLCIGVECLSADVRVVQYHREDEDMPFPSHENVRYKRAADDVNGKVVRVAKHPLRCTCCLMGDILLQRFRADVVGSLVEPIGAATTKEHRLLLPRLRTASTDTDEVGVAEDDIESRILSPDGIRRILDQVDKTAGTNNSETADLQGGSLVRIPNVP